MSDPRDEIARIIADAEKAAYERGWHEALLSVAIAENPGMSGVDVVKAAQAIDNMIKERTVRTALRRMRLAKVIWKRSGLWYPKAKEKIAENGNGEAVGSPPH